MDKRDLEKDRQTTSSTGSHQQALPEGVFVQDTVVHTDARGMVFETFNQQWTHHGAPLVVHSYIFTIRPRWTKGWAVHTDHDDRYIIVKGHAEVVLYDGRETSSTYGRVFTIVLSESHRRMVNIPVGIWHATQNLGTEDCILINHPTKPYSYEDPDKYRLPLDTDKIPYKFHYPQGW